MKKIVAYLLIFVVIASLSVFISENTLKNHEKEILSQEKELLQATYHTIVKAYKTHAEIFFLNRINTKEVIELMKEASLEKEKRDKARESLYKLLEPSYNSMQTYKIKQLHFQLPNNESFLRFHRPNLFGDSLVGIRESIEWVNKNKKPFLGFEEGKIYNGYRFVFPILDAENHYGSVETSVSVKAIIKQMEEELKLKANFIIKKDLVKKKVFDFEQDNYIASKISSDYLYEKDLLVGRDIAAIEATSSAYKKLSMEIASSTIFNFSIPYNDSMFITTYIPVINELTKERVAYIVTTRQSKDLSYLYRKNSIIRVVIIALLAMLIFAFYKIQKNTQEIKEKNIVLNEVQKIAKLGSWEFIASSGEIKWSNEVFSIFGVEPNTFKPTYEIFLSFVHKDDVEKLKESFESSIASKNIYEMHHRIIKSDGSLAYVDERGYHIYDEHGEHIKSFGTVHDVTRIVEYETKLHKARSELVSIANNINDILFRYKIDYKRTPLYLNNAIYTISGYKADEFMNSQEFSYIDIIHPEDIEYVNQQITKAIEDSIPYTVEYRIINAKGKTLWVRESGKKVIYNDIDIIEGIITDITYQKDSLEKLQKFIDTQDSIIVLTSDEKLIFANKKFFDFFGYKDLSDFYKYYSCICQMFIENDNFFHLGKVENKKKWLEELQNLNAKDRMVSMLDGPQPYAFALSINNYEDDIYIINFTDISDTFEEKLQLQEKVTHDHLTKAYNRAYFDSTIKTLLKNATLEGRHIGIILFDIDHFKSINDTYGHDKGDHVLSSLANLVKHSIRSSDKLVRWGGEEFVIVCSTHSIKDTIKKADYIRNIIENYTFEIPRQVTCSFGVSMVDEDIQKSIKRADENLYEAKKTGRNRVYPLFSAI